MSGKKSRKDRLSRELENTLIRFSPKIGRRSSASTLSLSPEQKQTTETKITGKRKGRASSALQQKPIDQPQDDDSLEQKNTSTKKPSTKKSSNKSTKRPSKRVKQEQASNRSTSSIEQEKQQQHDEKDKKQVDAHNIPVEKATQPKTMSQKRESTSKRTTRQQQKKEEEIRTDKEDQDHKLLELETNSTSEEKPTSRKQQKPSRERLSKTKKVEAEEQNEEGNTTPTVEQQLDTNNSKVPLQKRRQPRRQVNENRSPASSIFEQQEDNNNNQSSVNTNNSDDNSTNSDSNSDHDSQNLSIEETEVKSSPPVLPKKASGVKNRNHRNATRSSSSSSSSSLSSSSSSSSPSSLSSSSATSSNSVISFSSVLESSKVRDVSRQILSSIDETSAISRTIVTRDAAYAKLLEKYNQLKNEKNEGTDKIIEEFRREVTQKNKAADQMVQFYKEEMTRFKARLDERNKDINQKDVQIKTLQAQAAMPPPPPTVSAHTLKLEEDTKNLQLQVKSLLEKIATLEKQNDKFSEQIQSMVLIVFMCLLSPPEKQDKLKTRIVEAYRVRVVVLPSLGHLSMTQLLTSMLVWPDSTNDETIHCQMVNCLDKRAAVFDMKTSQAVLEAALSSVSSDNSPSPSDSSSSSSGTSVSSDVVDAPLIEYSPRRIGLTDYPIYFKENVELATDQVPIFMTKMSSAVFNPKQSSESQSSSSQ